MNQQKWGRGKFSRLIGAEHEISLEAANSYTHPNAWDLGEVVALRDV